MSDTKKGFFVVLDGMEGAGKTTQVARLAERFTKRGYEVVTTREPGGSPGAEEIRGLLLSGETEKWDGVAEILLFGAARRSHVEMTIKPALAAGKMVFCDRFIASTIAYQGFGQQHSLEMIDQVNKVVLGSFKPDLTFIFFIDPVLGMQRAIARGALNRMEKHRSEFFDRVTLGYRSVFDGWKRYDSDEDPSYRAVNIVEGDPTTSFGEAIPIKQQIDRLTNHLELHIRNTIERRQPWLIGHNERL